MTTKEYLIDGYTWTEFLDPDPIIHDLVMHFNLATRLGDCLYLKNKKSDYVEEWTIMEIEPFFHFISKERSWFWGLNERLYITSDYYFRMAYRDEINKAKK